MQKQQSALWILMAALAFVFGTFGTWKFANPALWIGWIPPWMENALGLKREAWLPIIAAIELLLTAGLLIPIRNVQRLAAMLMTLHLFAVLTQTGWNVTAVRDAGLLLASVSLWLAL